MKHYLAPAIALLLVGVSARPASGAEATELGSPFVSSSPFHLQLSAGYQHTLRRGAFKRELIGDVLDPLQGSTKIVKEGRYSQVRHILNLGAKVSLPQGVQVHFGLPIVLADNRTLGFEQNGGDPCPGNGANPRTEDNCVTPYNSTLVADGFLDQQALLANPFRVLDWAGSSPPRGGMLLPTRGGIDQLHMGISWAPVRQADDPTKPTFVVGYEARIGLGSIMSYDPANPTANRAVGRGVDEHRVWLAVSRRFNRYVDPWFSIYYMAPVAHSDSLFEKTSFPGSGQLRGGPQQRAGLDIGVEFVPWEQPAAKHKVAIELSGFLNAIFEGRGYSPIWEVLSANNQLSGPCLRASDNPTGPMLWDNGSYCRSDKEILPFPGITHIENYMNMGARLALHVHLAQYIYASLLLVLAHDTAHFITYEDAGRSLNPNGTIDLNDPRQVNPMYRPLIDAPGRRFRVEETTIFDFALNLTAQF